MADGWPRRRVAAPRRIRLDRGQRRRTHAGNFLSGADIIIEGSRDPIQKHLPVVFPARRRSGKRVNPMSQGRAFIIGPGKGAVVARDAIYARLSSWSELAFEHALVTSIKAQTNES